MRRTRKVLIDLDTEETGYKNAQGQFAPLDTAGGVGFVESQLYPSGLAFPAGLVAGGDSGVETGGAVPLDALLAFIGYEALPSWMEFAEAPAEFPDPTIAGSSTAHITEAGLYVMEFVVVPMTDPGADLGVVGVFPHVNLGATTAADDPIYELSATGFTDSVSLQDAWGNGPTRQSQFLFVVPAAGATYTVDSVNTFTGDAWLWMATTLYYSELESTPLIIVQAYVKRLLAAA